MTSATAFLLCILVGAEPARAVDFATEVVPVLTRAGCNSGACHGAAAGRGGFHLSLLGGDAPSDYEAIVHALEGRRINLARPSASLLLAKPTGQLDHGGGAPLDEDGAAARRLRDWIVTGAPRGNRRVLTQFHVTPDRHFAERPGATVTLRAVARFDDGPEEDVTPWTVFQASDPAAVEIDRDRHQATIHRRGRQVVIARFLDRALPLQWSVPLADRPIDHAAEPRVNFIDDLVLETLTTLRLPVAPPAVDATFLRRVRLDLTGRLPARSEVERFLADKAADKRGKKIDELLRSDDFVEIWTLRYARLLRLHSLSEEGTAGAAYAQWLRSSLAANRPWNEMAFEMLTATGDSHAVGPANFARMTVDARGQAELVGQVFLGVRLQCANCHNHPLDRWTQDDYHGLAAVFARLERGRHVRVALHGAVTNLRTNEPAVPRIPGLRYLDPDRDGRAEFARWVASRDNPLVARAHVNRLWRTMFGRGLIEPADDLRATNPATHSALLIRLAADFAEHGFDIRHTLRQIAASHVYARSAASFSGDESVEPFYSQASFRPLEPEVMADMLADVTGVPDEYPRQPAGTRAVMLVDPLMDAPALDILGRCSRAAGCEPPTTGIGLPARLHLLNGELVNRKLVDPNGRLQRSLAASVADAELLEDMMLRALGRPPSDAERDHWLSLAKSVEPSQRTRWWEDWAWSLLNSREFLTNH